MAFEPASQLPVAGSVSGCIADVMVLKTVKENTQPVEVDRFHDPPVKAGFNVQLCVFFEERG
jgi:hypothetical protein